MYLRVARIVMELVGMVYIAIKLFLALATFLSFFFATAYMYTRFGIIGGAAAIAAAFVILVILSFAYKLWEAFWKEVEESKPRDFR